MEQKLVYASVLTARLAQGGVHTECCGGLCPAFLVIDLFKSSANNLCV